MLVHQWKTHFDLKERDDIVADNVTDQPPARADLAGLSDRFRTPVTPEPEQLPMRPKSRWGAPLRWSGVGALLVASVLLLGVAGSVGVDNEAELAQGVPAIKADIERTIAAEDDLANMFTIDEATLLLDQMVMVGGNVAKLQNTYLAEAGPLTLEGIPKVEGGDTSSFDRTLTEDERWELAKTQRENTLLSLSQRLMPYFTSNTDESAKGFVPASNWFQALETKGLVAGDYQWSTAAPKVFSPEGTVEMVWELRSKDGNKLAGWVSAHFEPIPKKLMDARIGTVLTGDAATTVKEKP